jgi:hypothetical protein
MASRYSTAQHSAVQHSTVQHSATQCSTAQYSAAQRSGTYVIRECLRHLHCPFMTKQALVQVQLPQRSVQSKSPGEGHQPMAIVLRSLLQSGGTISAEV